MKILMTLFLLCLLLPNQAWAGPSYQEDEMEYGFSRPLKVVSKMSNGFRFDIVTPEQSVKVLGSDVYYSDSSNYGDTYLVAWPPIDDTGIMRRESVYITRLRSDDVHFIDNGPLADDYIIIREWSGGASCCSIVHAFQTKPEFKKLIEHDNDFFDMPTIPIGEHEIELHENPESYPSSHSQLKYNPKVFDLRKQEWKEF